MATGKRVKRDSKDAAAGKLKRTTKQAAKIFTPTAEQPKDPNAKPAKKPGMVITQAFLNAAGAPGPGNDSIGSGHMSMGWYRKMGNPWS